MNRVLAGPLTPSEGNRANQERVRDRNEHALMLCRPCRSAERKVEQEALFLWTGR